MLDFSERGVEDKELKEKFELITKAKKQTNLSIKLKLILDLEDNNNFPLIISIYYELLKTMKK